jgi:hypothetical protein
MREREPLRETAAWGGTGTVYTTLGFTAVRGWFEFASIVLADECPELRLVNATEGGARITGFEEQKLADVLRDLPVRQITAQQLSEAARQAVPPLTVERIRSWCHEYAGLAREVRQAARRIRRLTEVALSALKAGNAPQVVRNFSKLELAELALRRAVARIPFVDAWAHAAIEPENKQAAQLGSDDQENARRSVAREQHIASAIETAALELEAELERVRSSLLPEPLRTLDEVESATM